MRYKAEFHRKSCVIRNSFPFLLLCVSWEGQKTSNLNLPIGLSSLRFRTLVCRALVKAIHIRLKHRPYFVAESSAKKDTDVQGHYLSNKGPKGKWAENLLSSNFQKTKRCFWMTHQITSSDNTSLRLYVLKLGVQAATWRMIFFFSFTLKTDKRFWLKCMYIAETLNTNFLGFLLIVKLCLLVLTVVAKRAT